MPDENGNLTQEEIDDILTPVSCDKTPRQMQIKFAEQCYEKYLKSATEKSKPLRPWDEITIGQLYGRLLDECKELEEELVKNQVHDEDNFSEIMDECKDVANFAWFINEWAKGKRVAVQK